MKGEIQSTSKPWWPEPAFLYNQLSSGTVTLGFNPYNVRSVTVYMPFSFLLDGQHFICSLPLELLWQPFESFCSSPRSLFAKHLAWKLHREDPLWLLSFTKPLGSAGAIIHQFCNPATVTRNSHCLGDSIHMGAQQEDEAAISAFWRGDGLPNTHPWEAGNCSGPVTTVDRSTARQMVCLLESQTNTPQKASGGENLK